MYVTATKLIWNFLISTIAVVLWAVVFNKLVNSEQLQNLKSYWSLADRLVKQKDKSMKEPDA